MRAHTRTVHNESVILNNTFGRNESEGNVSHERMCMTSLKNVVQGSSGKRNTL